MAIFARRRWIRLYDIVIPAPAKGLVASAAVEGCSSPLVSASVYLPTGGRVTDASVEIMSAVGLEASMRGSPY